MGEKPSFFNPNYLLDENVLEIVETENDIIDARSDAFYRASLFDVEALKVSDMYDSEDLTSPKNRLFENLDRRFRAEYEACESMLERIALFLSPQYLPYLNSLDLDKTRNVLDHTALDYMVEEYREMGHALIDKGFVDGELSREVSGREIHFRPPASIDENEHGLLGNRELSIGTRNRPLLRFEVEIDGEKYCITITKRMTFAIPTKLMLELTEDSISRDNTRSIEDWNSLEYMENILDEHDPQVIPIRTLYYASSKKVKDHVSTSSGST